jgi:hypothetical protein
VKFLGDVEVDQPKGSEMVRDAIRKMKFNKQIKKAEGQKPPKVELLISIDNITILEPKSKVVQFQYPLHHVSYCADDKSDKKMFTFIARDRHTEKHRCFVFDSEKCAEEITLTLGQAFDLAYKRFLESSSKHIDTKKQLLVLQHKVNELTNENVHLKERVAFLEKLLDHKQHEVVNGTARSSEMSLNTPPTVATSNDRLPVLSPPPPVPSRSHIPTQSPTPSPAVDLFGSAPFSTSQSPCQPAVPFHHPSDTVADDDPFGMPTFSPTSTQSFHFEHEHDIMDIQASFSRGLSIGTEDFSLEDFDPCKK